MSTLETRELGLRYTYCRSWSGKRKGPLDPLSAEEARRRFEGLVPEPNHWFSVAAQRVGGAVDDAPEFVLEILPHADFINVKFVDQYHTQRFLYGFKKLDSKLFMTNITEHNYPEEPRFFDLDESLTVEQIVIKPSGYVKQVLYDYKYGKRNVSEYRGVDVAGNWQEIPEFGEWDELGEFER
jgi:hypothetical protein